MAEFKKAKVGEIRTIELMEGSGCGDKWVQLTIHIGYSVEGDYTESDKHPFNVKVFEAINGEISAERIEGAFYRPL